MHHDHDHDHYSDDDLLDAALGRLDADQMRRVEAYLRDHPDREQRMNQLRTIVDVTRNPATRLTDPPAGLIDKTSALFGTVRPDLVQRSAVNRLSSSLATLRRIIATLEFDTGSGAALAGLRSGTDLGTRHLTFQSPVADLDLQIVAADEPSTPHPRWQLMGQLDGTELTGERTLIFVRARPEKPDTLSSELNELDRADRVTMLVGIDGYFSGTLRTGNWVACLAVDDALLLFPGIDL